MVKTFNTPGTTQHAAVVPPAATLPAEITAHLLTEVDTIARRMARGIAEDIPLGPQFRTVGYLRAVLAACRDGVGLFLRMLHDGRRPNPQELSRLGHAGRRQAELGVPLEVLLSAYRLAARLVWQEVIAEGTQLAALPPQTVVTLTGQVLEYLDEISGVVGTAYLAARERLLRQRDLERERVLRRLLAGDDPASLRSLAAAHDIELHFPYRVVACSAGEDADRELGTAWAAARAHLIPDQPAGWIMLTPVGADLRGLITGADPALRFGLGPVADGLGAVADAARRARAALEAGQRLHPSVTVHDERELGIFAALATNQAELGRYVDHVLGALATVPPVRRAGLLSTLEAVLTSPSLAQAALTLGVHRHTLVYRVRRLAELLGTDLHDPLERHHLWLAVQAQRLLT